MHICAAVIEDCWTGEFFAGSAGHFKQFWTRDLAMCTPALCRLGHGERVVRSWEWGLERFDAGDYRIDERTVLQVTVERASRRAVLALGVSVILRGSGKPRPV